MRIWFDIVHLAQLNFYRNSIFELSKKQQVIVTIINRGKLVRVTKNDLGNLANCMIVPIGVHNGGKISAIFEANILRLLQLFVFYFKFKPQITVGNGFLHGIIGKIFRIPSIMFGDDIERYFDVYLKTLLSKEVYYVTGSLDKNNNNKIRVFNALKEWSYLSPKYFKPNEKALLKYNIKKNNYIFVREVITGTLNYQSQKGNLIAQVADKFPPDIPVLFSLEDKNTFQQYPNSWILLEEPVEDIHSLIYYSRILLSSGDSMAREGAMLGVPSIYCGVREMNANSIMLKKGKLYHKCIDDVPVFLKQFIESNSFDDKENFRSELDHQWIDVTDFIVGRINSRINSILK